VKKSGGDRQLQNSLIAGRQRQKMLLGILNDRDSEGHGSASSRTGSIEGLTTKLSGPDQGPVSLKTGITRPVAVVRRSASLDGLSRSRLGRRAVKLPDIIPTRLLMQP